MLATAMVGMFASIYLLITYVTGKPIVCGLESGCDLVRASAQAKTIFNLPRPLLGVVFYSVMMGLLIARIYVHKRSALWTNSILAWAGIGLAESAWLVEVQAFQMHAYCTWCLTSAACTLVLFVLAFFEGEKEPDEYRTMKELKWTFYALLIGIVGGGLLMWSLLSQEAGGNLMNIGPVTGSSALQLLVPPGTPTYGDVTSTVTVTEFLDLECPACRAFYPTMKQIRDEYADRVRFAYRLFPLTELHPHARAAAIADTCAERQGKFLEYADAALLNQQALERPDLIRYADALGLNDAQFQTCLDDPTAAAQVDTGRKAGDALGINGTPTIFINDVKLDSPPTYDQFKQLLDNALAGK